MIGIVIIAHGGLATEFRAAVEHVVGPQSGLCTVSVEVGHDRADKQAEICRAADAVDEGDGVVLVADIFGGSPSNLSMMACSRRNRAILYGANLPMLIKLMKSRHLTLTEAISAARDAGRRYINSMVIGDAEGITAAPAPMTAAAVPAPVPPRVMLPIRDEATHRPGPHAATGTTCPGNPRPTGPRPHHGRTGHGKLTR